LLSMAQMMRAVLAAKATMATLEGRRARRSRKPRIRDATPLLLPQVGAGAADQKRPQYTVSLFGDASWPMLAAGAVVLAGEASASI